VGRLGALIRFTEPLEFIYNFVQSSYDSLLIPFVLPDSTTFGLILFCFRFLPFVRLLFFVCLFCVPWCSFVQLIPVLGVLHLCSYHCSVPSFVVVCYSFVVIDLICSARCLFGGDYRAGAQTICCVGALVPLLDHPHSAGLFPVSHSLIVTYLFMELFIPSGAGAVGATL